MLWLLACVASSDKLLDTGIPGDCADDALPYIYTESFVHPMDWEASEGSCLDDRQEATLVPELPPLTTLPEVIETGITFPEGDLSEGRIAVGGVSRDFLPFNLVDCSECAGGPWYELHAMLAGEDDACFAILYLFPEDPTFVQVEYGLCLPTLERLSEVVEAPWEGALEVVAGPPGLAAGVTGGPPGGVPPRPVPPEVSARMTAARLVPPLGVQHPAPLHGGGRDDRRGTGAARPDGVGAPGEDLPATAP